MFAFRKHTAALLLSGLTVVAATHSAAAYDINLRDAYGDEYGNIIVQDPNGPKMIFVGATAAKSDRLARELRKKVTSGPRDRRSFLRPAIPMLWELFRRPIHAVMARLSCAVAATCMVSTVAKRPFSGFQAANSPHLICLAGPRPVRGPLH